MLSLQISIRFFVEVNLYFFRGLKFSCFRDKLFFQIRDNLFPFFANQPNKPINLINVFPAFDYDL